MQAKNLFKRVPWLYHGMVAVFGASNGGLSPRGFLRKYGPPSAQGVILNLGSGSRPRVGDAIHVDATVFPGVDVVSDIAELPFQDGSVDAILCLAVLEHVPDPVRIVREIHRVLRPGGVCYLTTPFMQPYHSSPQDYQRWTLDGLRILLSDFLVERTGVRHGPTSALTLVLANWFAIICGLGSRRLSDIFLMIWAAMLAPVAHVFDLPLNRLRISENMASGYFIVGRKRPTSHPSV